MGLRGLGAGAGWTGRNRSWAEVKEQMREKSLRSFNRLPDGGPKAKGRTEEKVWGGQPDFRKFGLKAFMGQKEERNKKKIKNFFLFSEYFREKYYPEVAR
jgi:hypothetical protein